MVNFNKEYPGSNQGLSGSVAGILRSSSYHMFKIRRVATFCDGQKSMSGQIKKAGDILTLVAA